MNLALGLIETKGLVGAIEAADAMAKAADVEIVDKEKVTGGLMVIKITGEVAAVKSALDAGSAAAQRVGQLISVHIIPRPDNQIDFLISSEHKKHGKRKHGMQTGVKNVPKIENKTVEKEEVKTVIKKKTPAVKKSVEKKATVTVPKKTNVKKTKPKVAGGTKTASSVKGIPPLRELEILNVHSLRKLARSVENFPIKGREISKANRGKLLDYFKDLL